VQLRKSIGTNIRVEKTGYQVGGKYKKNMMALKVTRKTNLAMYRVSSNIHAPMTEITQGVTLADELYSHY